MGEIKWNIWDVISGKKKLGHPMTNRFDYPISTKKVAKGLVVNFPKEWLTPERTLLIPTMVGLLELIMTLQAAADRIEVEQPNG